MKGENQSIYYKPVVPQVHRLLSWQDREPFSKTYGSFDRTYWCWKFTDFPGARFQEGIYTLAYLFSYSFDGNIYVNGKQILAWALAGMRYWQKIQYKDGSFDEAYPFERSLAATAFTCFYVGEAFLLLRDHISKNEHLSLCRTFEKAGIWLCANDEKHGVLSNHLAAAAAALQTIYQICGDEKFKNRSQYFIHKIYHHQSEEGWYKEYGGADPGYQTHCTFYLAYIWKKTKNSQLLESLRRSLSFLKYFIHTNGTLGGEYGSRNTEFYFPAGFEILAPVLPDAALITESMRLFVSKQDIIGPAAMDAFNFLPMVNNYLFAADHAIDIGKVTEPMPHKKKGWYPFPDAGLYIKATSLYYSILGVSKGGILKVFDQKTGLLLHNDCGYWAKLTNGAVISSQSFKRDRQWNKNEECISVEADFTLVNQGIQTPFLFIGFRLFTLILGRIPIFSQWIKNMIVRVLIQKRKKVPVIMLRRVSFEEERIYIHDQISLKGTCEIQEFRQEAKFSTIHMGSSRYFHKQELDIIMDNGYDWSEELMQKGKIDIKKCLDLKNMMNETGSGVVNAENN